MHQYSLFTQGKDLKEASKALILLHGRGGSAQDILTLSDSLIKEDFYCVAPQATNYTWYPYSFMALESQNEPWLSSAVQIVKKLLDETNQFIPSENIYIVGFSQGACLTLEFVSRYAQKLGGVSAFIGGLIGDRLIKERYQGNFDGTKVAIINSTQDPHVPLDRSEKSAQIIQDLGAEVSLKIYPNMPHTITLEALNFVKNWIF